MHRRGALVEHLHAVTTDVARAAFRIASMDMGQGDEASAVLRPALEDGKIAQAEAYGFLMLDSRFSMVCIQVRAFRIDYLNNLLACRLADGFGSRVEEMNSLFQQRETFAKIRGRFGLEDELNFLGDFVDVLAAQCHGHAFTRTHGVDSHGKLRNFAVDYRLLEQQSFPAAG